MPDGHIRDLTEGRLVCILFDSLVHEVWRAPQEMTETRSGDAWRRKYCVTVVVVVVQYAGMTEDARGNGRIPGAQMLGDVPRHVPYLLLNLKCVVHTELDGDNVERAHQERGQQTIT